MLCRDSILEEDLEPLFLHISTGEWGEAIIPWVQPPLAISSERLTTFLAKCQVFAEEIALESEHLRS
jgi:hypothetical protein